MSAEVSDKRKGEIAGRARNDAHAGRGCKYAYVGRTRNDARAGRIKVVLIVILAIVVLLGVSAVVTYSNYSSSLKPVDSDSTDEIVFVVKEGWTTVDIASALKNENLIKSEFFFKVQSKLKEKEGTYKAGKYILGKDLTMDEIIAIIKKGSRSDDVTRFTIPEGYSLEQTIEVIVDKGLSTEVELFDEIENGDFDYKFIKELPPGDNRLEGFLYPETYEVYNDASAHDILNKMLGQFDKVFLPEYYDEAKAQGRSVFEIVTIASLIEGEASLDDERPKIGGVIANRLAKGMKLQLDATVQYLLDEKREFLRQSDLDIDSPYNTYLYDGIPPGPICSPRIASITAALDPDDNDYLYYVLKPTLDGHHSFSADYSKFLKDKDAYYAAIKKRDS